MNKVIILLLLALVGCKSTEPTVIERIKTDTLRQTIIQRDSIHVHDSTVIQQRGDTVYCDRWHTAWRDRLKIDTLYKSRTDTITKEVKIEVEKRKPFLASLRDNIVLAILFFIFGFAANWLRKFKR